MLLDGLKTMRQASWLLAALAALATLTHGLGGEPALTRFEFSQAHMGTQFKIVLYAPDASTATRAANAAFERIAELDQIMSDYRDDSELMLLCRRAGGPPMKVSEDLFRVLTKSQEIARESNGAFDITVGPVVRLWRRARRQHELPDPGSLSEALKLVGYENLRLDLSRRTAQLLKRGMMLDLGGIGKGDAADQALLVLKQYGIRAALVAGGGDIAVGDPPPERDSPKGWRIGIRQLADSRRGSTSLTALSGQSKGGGPPQRFVFLHDAGISTSGEAEQHVEIGGIRYSHIVDPKTGKAVTGRSSVTVIAPNDITADALATAISVMGPRAGIKLAEALPGAGVLILQRVKNNLKTFESRFPSAR